jgi:hypothetical protein
VWVFFTCLYLLSIGRGFYSSDGEVMFKTTAALVQRHTFALPPDPGLPQIVRGHDSAFYSKYDPGLPLIAVPFYAAGDGIARVNQAHRIRLAAILVLLIPALSAAGSLAGLAYLIRQQHVSARGAFWVLVAAGCASPLWVYARTLFPEAALACTLTWAVVMIGGTKRGRQKKNQGAASSAPPPDRAAARLFAAGMIFGVGVLIRAALLIYLPALVVLILRIRRRPLSSRVGDEAKHQGAASSAPTMYRLVSFTAGMLPFVVILRGHNALRFGNPLTFGYAGEGFTTPIWKGVIGLLISPGKGALMYAPPLLLCALLWPRFRRLSPALADCIALAWVSALIFYGSWWAWDGGWCWGPRFLVPLLPLSALPLTMIPAGRRWRIALAALIGIGIAVQLPGVFTDIIPHYADHAAGRAADIDRINFSLSGSPLAGSMQRLVQGRTEPLGLFHLDETGLPITWTAGVPALLIGGALVSFWGMIKSIIHRRETP